LIADFELDGKHEEFVVVGMVDEMNVHHALFASETFFTGCVKMELDKLVGVVAEGDAVGAGCCVELDGVPGVGDIDWKGLVVDFQPGHIGGGFLCALDIDRRFGAATFASVKVLADFASVFGSVFAVVGPVVVRFGRRGERNEGR